MDRHRFREWLDTDTLHPTAAPAAVANGFMMCPVAVMPPALVGWFYPWQVYQMAFEQAKASVQSGTGRPFTMVWN